MIFKRGVSALLLLFLLVAQPAQANYHLLGWVNTFVPGGGEIFRGNTKRGLLNLGTEAATFAAGYELSNSSVFSIDGFTTVLPDRSGRRRRSNISYARELSGDVLQEFGLKTHMVNTYLVYRDQARLEGDTEQFDPRPLNDMLLSPFNTKYITNPWVFAPLAAIAAYSIIGTVIDINTGAVQSRDRFDAFTNNIYAFKIGVWQPIGSGVPEEMFYRGFLQREFQSWVNSPFFSIPLSTALFSLSHAPGSGRYGALVSGAYLGYLAYKNDGELGPGITLHFWAEVLLGIQAVVEWQRGQRTTPPAGFSIQLNF